MKINRMGGSAPANLAPKVGRDGKLETTVHAIPPNNKREVGISVLEGNDPQQAADQMRREFRGRSKIEVGSQVTGSATAADIRAAGFEVVHDSSSKLPNHASIIHPDGEAGWTPENIKKIICGLYGYRDHDYKNLGVINMRVQEGQIFHLLDAKKHLLGLVTICEFDGDWVRGHFIPEADFALYRDLFLAHLEACNDMLMATVEDLGKKIDALALHLVAPDGTKTQGIYSVEMMEGDGISFKVRLGYEGIPNVNYPTLKGGACS